MPRDDLFKQLQSEAAAAFEVFKTALEKHDWDEAVAAQVQWFVLACGRSLRRAWRRCCSDNEKIERRREYVEEIESGQSVGLVDYGQQTFVAIPSSKDWQRH